MSPIVKILYLEYLAGEAAAAEGVIKQASIPFQIFVVGDRQSYIDALSGFAPDIIIADDLIPSLKAVDALAILKQAGLTIPLIVLTTPQPVNYAANIVNTMKNGAYDYILKDDIGRLPHVINSAIKKEKTENKLLLSDHRYRQIVETAQEGIWIINKDLVTVFVNQKMCDILGYSAEEIMGKHNYDFKIDGDKTSTLERISGDNTGIGETHESTFVTKAGKIVYCNVATNGLFDEEGRYMGRLAMMTDITQRKADEETLKRSQANLSAIIENTTDLVYSLDSDLKFITYNQLFKTTIKAVYGFDIEQGGNCLDLINKLPPYAVQEWKDIYTKALNGETMQFVNEYPDGDDTVYLSYSVNPIRETGKVIGLSCFSRNITQQKLDEVAIRKSEVSLRTIFNNTDMACMLIDDEGKVVSFNMLAQKLSQYYNNKSIVTGLAIADSVDEGRKPFVLDVLEKTKNGPPVNYQISREKDGVVRWFDITWARIKDGDQEDFGYIFTNKDITEQKELEIEREKITIDLLQRNKALEQFTYIISHNLRAPVANIIGLSSLTTDIDVIDGEVSQIIKSISQSAYKLDEVISDLNQVLQVNKNINENAELISLPALIEGIEFSIKHLFDKEQVSIICNFENADSMVSLKSFIHNIFYNLILNSIKYRNPGITPVIHITTASNNNKLQIKYKDNGRGIDITKHGNDIFGLYKRFDTSVEGKGIGLFMVKKQVESIGGNISVKSVIDEGTEFLIEFSQTSFQTMM